MAFFNVREWIDRISQHPNRRTLTNVEDPTDVKTYDLSRAEGDVTTQGTAITGANLTDLENRIGAAFTAVENAMPEANPAETATGSLTKLKVRGTVYEIEGGGSEPQTGTIEDVEVASFSDGADNVPVSELIVDIDAVQDLHGYDKPWTGGAGKNKLPNTASTSTIEGVTFTVNDDGSITASGTSTGWTGLTVGTCTLPAGTYKVSSGIINEGYYYEARINDSNYNTANRSVSIPFTLEEPTEVTVKAYAAPNYQINNVTGYPMIIIESETDLTYEPYSNICPITGHDSGLIRVDADQVSNIYKVDFGQTVYGGYLNVTTGLMTITHGIISDLGALDWTGWSGSDGTFYTYNFNVIPKNWTRDSENWGKCSALKVENWYSIDRGTYSNNSIHGLSYNNFFILRVYASDYSTVDELKAALSGQVLVYELATPIDIQLTPVQVKTLLGNNNIFADTGNIEKLVYFKTGCENIAKLVEAYSEKDDIQTVLLEATDWDSSTNTITVDVTGVTATSNQEILSLPATSAANIANNKALQSANLMDYGQAEGQITLYAENIPSEDLSIRVIVRA